MSTKNIKKEIEVDDSNEKLSAKELYDIQKEERLKEKEKNLKTKKRSSKKKSRKVNTTNLGAKVFAIFMLLLMVASVVISILVYL